MIIKKTILIVLVLFFMTTPSFAYLDPGTGGSLLQIIIAAIAGLTAGISFYWRKLIHFIKKVFSKNKEKDK